MESNKCYFCKSELPARDYIIIGPYGSLRRFCSMACITIYTEDVGEDVPSGH